MQKRKGGFFLKINNIKINNFGKIKNKEINFENNINLIYGKNEAGKTTILKFISSMFYGANKNKNGNEISDFDQYEPWLESDFSGKINYELNNKKSFEIFRDFRKKNPKIYNENSEDISKQFNIDKNKGNEFFKEQTGIEEELFYSTIVAEQEKVKLNEKEQNVLLQKMTNLVSSGSDSLSYKKAEDRLKNRLLDEVGTDRTTEKPKNKVRSKLAELEQEYKRLEVLSEKQYEFDELERQKKIEINDNENYVNAIKEILNIKENEFFENKLIKNNENEINNLEKNIEKIKNEKNNLKKNKSNKKLQIILLTIFLFLLFFTIISFVFIKIKLINYISLFFTIINFLSLLFLKINEIKNNKKYNEEKIKKAKELEILENNLQNKKVETGTEKEKINKKILDNKKEIENKYSNIFLNTFFSKDLNGIKSELEKREEKNNELKINLKEIQMERKNTIPQIEKMPELEGQIESLNEQKDELDFLEKTIQLARRTLEESYNEMKKDLTPKFTNDLSNIINKISDGKYKNVKFSDEEGLLVELENGEYKKAERLSTGTVFQMYLALRLSMAETITEEKLPIILDEVFAYYDDERLENILNYIAKEYSDRQIIIFTCSKREKEALDKNKINYNYIEI